MHGNTVHSNVQTSDAIANQLEYLTFRGLIYNKDRDRTLIYLNIVDPIISIRTLWFVRHGIYDY